MLQFRVKPLGCITIALLFAGLLIFAFGPFRKSVSTTPSKALPESIAGFPSVAADDKAIKDAFSATDLIGLRENIGKQGAVTGIVGETTVIENRKDTLIRFSGDPGKTILVVVGDDERPLFPGLNNLLGRTILVEGELILYKDQPAVKVMAPAKLRVIAP